MIKFTGFASEHKEIPEYLYVKGENKENKQYCTYAYLETDEINTDTSEKICIAVMTYKPKRSQRNIFVFSEPIWNFIADERTKEQQNFLNKNLDKINDIWVEYANSQGYLLKS